MKKLKITKDNLATVYGAIKRWFKNNPYTIQCQYYPEAIVAYSILGEDFYKNLGIIDRPIKNSIEYGFDEPTVSMFMDGYWAGIDINGDMYECGRESTTIPLGSKISISPTQIKVYYEFGYYRKQKAILLLRVAGKGEVKRLLTNELEMSKIYDEVCLDEYTDDEIREAREKETEDLLVPDEELTW